MMLPVNTMPQQVAMEIHSILADVDDTITIGGRLSAAAYTALENAYYSGLNIVLVTGRPAGWCDMMARFWPVAGVVGENGAFYFAYDHISCKMRRRYAVHENTRQANVKRLHYIKDRILREVQGCAVAADQAYREADLAIDFCEDVEALSMDKAIQIKSIFEQEGATAKISSIHVNGWFGSYDKLSMTRIFLDEVLGLDMDAERDRFVFCGDSPNDAPMFDFFPNACGVSNVAHFLGTIKSEPAWIASKQGGEGFTEIVTTILDAQNKTENVS